jgi:hypothetical protein
MNVEFNILGTEDALNTWTLGSATVNGKTYKVQMVRFDEPSQYGIRKGKISKLYIADADRNMVANFDRGWDVHAKTAEVKAIVAAITKKFN